MRHTYTHTNRNGITTIKLKNSTTQNCLAQTNAVHKNITNQKTLATTHNKDTRKKTLTTAR